MECTGAGLRRARRHDPRRARRHRLSRRRFVRRPQGRSFDIGGLNRNMVLENDWCSARSTPTVVIIRGRRRPRQSRQELARAPHHPARAAVALARGVRTAARRHQGVVDFTADISRHDIPHRRLCADRRSRHAALVGRDGSIDWLCWPRFDSDACFAALLGSPEHGRWLIAPQRDGAKKITRRYRPNTLILETRFETDDGAGDADRFHAAARRRQFASRAAGGRRARPRDVMRTNWSLRFGYGAIVPWVTRLDDDTLRVVAGPDMVLLRTPVKIARRKPQDRRRIYRRGGREVPFVLTYAPLAPSRRRADRSADGAARRREEFWTGWAAHELSQGRGTTRSCAR